MASALKEIQQIEATQDQSLYSTLAKKLLQLAELIEDNKYTSLTERAATLPPDEEPEVMSLSDLSKELFVRINRVTVRVLNIWKKILNPQREAAVVSCGFLLLYCEVDPILKISPVSRIPIDKAIAAMKNYLSNPGHVVTVIRKTKEFIDKEMISLETFQRIKDLICKVTVEQVKNSDKTLTGFALYDLILFAVRYFERYAFEHYKLRVFENEACFKSKSPVSPYENLAVLQAGSRGGMEVDEIKSFNNTKSKSPLGQSRKMTVSNSSSPLSISNSKPRNKLVQKSAQFVQEKKKLEPSSTQRALKPHSTSPNKGKDSVVSPSSPKKVVSKVHIEDSSIKVVPKPLDKSLLVAKHIITTAPKSNSNRTTPVRSRKTLESTSDCVRTRDVLEEMQYHQFIEEKFRHFLVDKLKSEGYKLTATGLDRGEVKVAIEAEAIKNKQHWIEEFEKFAGIIRFNACKKLSDDKRYTAELIRAQRQLDILERYQ
jgi:hypothetical protein